MRLTQLDPVVVASGPRQVEQHHLESLSRYPYLFPASGLRVLELWKQRLGTKQRPWTLSGRRPEWAGGLLDLSIPSKYQLTRAVHDTHNLMLEFEGAPMVLWRWAVKQLGFSEGVYELIWTMIQSSQDIEDRCEPH